MALQYSSANVIPCATPRDARPLPGTGRVRVVQILATGTNGGAQEHVFNLLTKIGRPRDVPTVL